MSAPARYRRLHAGSHPTASKTRNWPAYTEALKRGGELTIWFDPPISWYAVPTGKRDRQQTCSDAALQRCLSIKVLFGMALRQRDPARRAPTVARRCPGARGRWPWPSRLAAPMDHCTC